jgi:myo-inositol 2-dehydrogenase/D-chiro-inositol 1-dehydrogenase
MDLRIGVVGTGAIGQDHTRRIMQSLAGATVVAVNDINRQSAEQARANFAPAAAIHDDPLRLIASADVDAILVTSWGPTHEEFVLAAIAAGKPVFCEKPLATTAAGCRRIVQAESRFGRRLVQVGFMRRYDRGYRMLKSAIARDRLGEPLVVHCAHRNQAVPESYTTEMAVVDTLIHELDVLRWLLNDDYATAQVIMPRKTRHAAKHLADPQLMLLGTRKGVRIDVEVFVNCRYGYDIQCEVVAEEGIARLPEPMSVALRHDARLSQDILTDWKLRFVDAYDAELQDFINAAKTGTAAGPSAWDGLAAAIASDACVAAQKSGSVVAIETPACPALYQTAI